MDYFLARHSTITLTMDRYAHSNYGEQIETLNVLPDLSLADHPTVKKMLATVNRRSLSLRFAGRQIMDNMRFQETAVDDRQEQIVLELLA